MTVETEVVVLNRRTRVPNEMLVNPALSTLSAPGTSGPVTVGASTTVNGTLTISGDVYTPGGNLSTALDVVAGGNYRFGSSSSAEMLYRTAPGQVRLTATLSADGLSSGGTALLGRDPSAPLEAATKQYADTKLTQAQGDARYVTTASGGLTQSAADVRYLQLAGGQMAGTLFSQRIEILSGMRLTLSGQPGDAFLSNDGTGLKFNYYGQDAIKIIDSAVVPMASYIDVGASANRFSKVWTKALDVAGALTFTTDNTWDVGSASLRPRDVYVARNLMLGPRLLGDFSSTVAVATRPFFQSAANNGATAVSAMPNGTGALSTFRAYNNSALTNAQYGEIWADANLIRVNSDREGSGAYLPLSFFVGGTERLRIQTSGTLQVAFAGGSAVPITPMFDLSTPNTAPGSSIVLKMSTGSGWAVGMGTIQGSYWHYFGGPDGTPYWGFDGSRVKLNTDTGWIPFAYGPGWTAYGDGNYGANAGYRRLATGLVILRGLVQGGAASTLVATLPAGFRPVNVTLVPAAMYGGIQRIDIGNDGGIRCAEMLAGVFSNLWLSMNGITFLAEA